jgi:glutamate 5-kinase
VSLLAAGVVEVDGAFNGGDAIEVCGPDGAVFAKGLVRYDASLLRTVAGRRTDALPDGVPHEVIHRDDLVMLP